MTDAVDASPPKKNGRPFKAPEQRTFERVTVSLTLSEAEALERYLQRFPGLQKATAAKLAMLREVERSGADAKG